ncbi:hypothetical protein CALVIDRAFT_553781 [Calocera viscosa TUFC12733]|uniref:Uncharacterized protein n=1 Tax=Calocera viscosa (strain TUFC12733) TaxID=1330018 RepID=A0A167P7D6_CALVF|nr:hypothetical protein CALVIDRAFT_553781 [Calocera viscosa TUFC12733]
MGASDAWQSQPQTPPLLLRTLELTSVCATFSLTFPSPLPSDVSQPKPSMSQTLTNGLAISLNSVPWQKVLVHIDEETDDEAIVVLYGLFPGRRYDVEVGIVRGERGGATVERVGRATEETPLDSYDSDTDTAVEDPPYISPRVRNRSGSSLQATYRSPGSPALVPSTPPRAGHGPSDPPPLPTLADRLHTLQQSLTSLQAQHAQLTAVLKTTRKDSQRSLAMLRSELDGMRRAAEKSQGGDMRARQKVLALQEAVRRAERGARECEDEAISTEGEWVELEGECATLDTVVREARSKEELARKELAAVQSKWSAVEAERDGELSSVRRNWEKWETRRERVEDVVQGLEKRLEEALMECESIEARWDTLSPDEGSLERTNSSESQPRPMDNVELSSENGATSAVADAAEDAEVAKKRESVWGGLSRRFSSSHN